MRKTIQDLYQKKKLSQKISVITSYDYSFTKICDNAGIDILLVGDSAGMVVLGYENTAKVTMDQMCLFTEAVYNGRENSLIISDMPFLSYQPNSSTAIKNAGKLIQSGADAVKLEGGKEMISIIQSIVATGIPVMGHIGFKPQTDFIKKGYKFQGKTKEESIKLIEDAKELEKAGVFGIVLEMVSAETAKIISEKVSIPTIGIGSGPYCDGQVLVFHDMLGIFEKIKPKFVKRYLSLSDEIKTALEQYKNDIEQSKFPNIENYFSMDKVELENLKKEIER